MNQRLAGTTPRKDAGRSALWIRAIAALPWSVLYAAARENLTGCFPERTAAQINTLLTAYYRQLAQVAVESFKMAGMSVHELRAHLAFVNFDLVRAESKAGRSVILLAAHQCNWEWALQGVTMQLEVPVDAAYKPLHGAASDRELRTLRVRFGAHLIAAKRLVREVVSRRRQVQLHAVALLADQAPTSSQGRHWLTFLGRDTAFYPGPGEIARMTGYAGFFVAMRRTARGRYTLEVQQICAADEKLEPPIFTARYAALVEAQIRTSPADWTWIHRRWKSARPVDQPAQG